MVSHRNDQLMVPVMMPIACRPLAARYLVIALAQIALGRLGARWASADNASLYRAEIVAALKPWSRNACPRVRREQGRAIYQLCAGLADASTSVSARAEMSEGTVDSLAAEVQMLRELVQAGAYSVVKEEAQKMPAGEQSLAALERIPV